MPDVRRALNAILATDSARELRVQLAQALSRSNPASPEILSQLNSALREPGEYPPDWQIYREISRVHRGRGEESAALVAVIKAISGAPTATEQAASEGLDLLRSVSSTELASALSAEDIELLRKALGACERKPVHASLFAAKLVRLRGDLTTAVAILQPLAEAPGSLPGEVVEEAAAALIALGRSKDALAYLVRASGSESMSLVALRAEALIDEGDYARGLDIWRAHPQSESLVPLGALALAGIGRLDEAISLLDGTSVGQTCDGALVLAILNLRRASSVSSGVPSQDAIQPANKAATTAARLGPADPEVNLVVAQVNLETGLDLDEGQRLLMHALLRLDNRPELSKWFRYQVRTRDGDSWFNYFRVAVAAARGASDEVLARSSSIDRSRTTYAQDGALALLEAKVLVDRKDLGAAAEAFTNAMSSFDYAGDLPHAVSAGREALSAERTADRTLDFVDCLWRLSFSAESPDRVDALTQEGLSSLLLYENDTLALDVGRAALLKGLLLRRQSSVAVARRVDLTWKPAPLVLIAALLGPPDPYRALHAAWTFRDCDADRTALFFAERAYALDSANASMQECIIAARVNYHGMFNSETEKLIDTYDDPTTWKSSVIALERLVAGKRDELREVTSKDLGDMDWGRFLLMRINALLYGFEPVEGELRAALDEARKPPADWNTAAEFAMLLGELDLSADLARSGLAAGDLTERQAVYALAEVDLVRSGGKQGFDALARHLESETSGLPLRSAANAELPLVKLAHPDVPGLSEALDRLIEIALHRAEHLPTDIPLSEEAASDPEPMRRKLVETLLDVTELIEKGRSDEAAALVDGLRRQWDSGLMGAALQQLEGSLRKPADGADSPSPSEPAVS